MNPKKEVRRTIIYIAVMYALQAIRDEYLMEQRRKQGR